ncbi:iron chelate uptake ABC transporter family permease subunit [Pontiellaceae bacterium B1224]|nr:iron chelate uptake ABC transporter family permease subunit [Pontiellaceae bacterium B1224]
MNAFRYRCAALMIFFILMWIGVAQSAPLHVNDIVETRDYQRQSLSNSGADWPSVEELAAVIFLKNYNTRLVVLSTMLLGIASGLVGSFLLLRKRSLMGDALSHACLPGIGILFIVMVSFGGSGKALPGLLAGASITGLIGVGCVLLIRNTSRIKDDAAMGIVLSVFFGLGVAVLGMVQTMPAASAAGLESFIYGKAASMVMQDAVLIGLVVLVCVVICILMFKELTLLCFDEAFTRALGWPLHTLDLILLSLVSAVTVIGLQSVGLILIIAFLITPVAAARFWTDDLRKMLLLAGLLRGLSGWMGSSISALTPRLPAGAVIVLVATLLFLVSMFFGTARGVLMRQRAQWRLQRKVGQQNLLRAVYELQEESARQEELSEIINRKIELKAVLAKRSWSVRQLRRLVGRAEHGGALARLDGKHIQLSESGFGAAARATRNHRLWETYLITHADVAPQHVDRDADLVEHVLGSELVEKLEECLKESGQDVDYIANPHAHHPGESVA